MVTKGETWERRDKSEAWDEHTQKTTITYKIDNQQGPPA